MKDKCFLCNGLGRIHEQPYGMEVECFNCSGTGQELDMHQRFAVGAAKGRYILEVNKITGKSNGLDGI